jgi:2-dehydropantoate 2-reductase
MGGHLARTGHDVILIGRPGHVSAVKEYGLRLSTPAGTTYILKMPAVTAPDQIAFTKDDVVFLCMKSQDTEGALKDLSAITNDLPIFCFQNGVRNEEIAAGYTKKVYGVMVRVGSIFLKEGRVLALLDPPGSYIIGCYPAGTDALIEQVAEELRTAGYFVRTTSDVMPYKWGKLMMNVGNAVGAITDSSRESTKSILRAVTEESRSILEKAGIKAISYEQVSREWPEITTTLRIKAEAQSSTWQSLARFRGSVETEFLNGEIVRVARRLGKQAPINEKLLHICQEMAANHEPPGKYSPSRLAEMLGLENT